MPTDPADNLLGLVAPEGADPPDGPSNMQAIIDRLAEVVGMVKIAQINAVDGDYAKFEDIPQTFRHLKVLATAKSKVTSGSRYLTVNFPDTGLSTTVCNQTIWLPTSTTAVVDESSVNRMLLGVMGISIGGGGLSAHEVDFFDYRVAQPKHVQCKSSYKSNVTPPVMATSDMVGVNTGTPAIENLWFRDGSSFSGLTSTSVFSLYGIL